MTQQIDISPEAVKALQDVRLKPLRAAQLIQWIHDADNMLTALVAERDAQTKRANEGWQNALDNANELYRIRQERDAHKATQARLCEALRQIQRIIDNGTMTNDDGTERTARRYREQIWPMINQTVDDAITAAKETLP